MNSAHAVHCRPTCVRCRFGGGGLCASGLDRAPFLHPSSLLQTPATTAAPLARELATVTAGRGERRRRVGRRVRVLARRLRRGGGRLVEANSPCLVEVTLAPFDDVVVLRQSSPSSPPLPAGVGELPERMRLSIGTREELRAAGVRWRGREERTSRDTRSSSSRRPGPRVIVVGGSRRLTMCPGRSRRARRPSRWTPRSARGPASSAAGEGDAAAVAVGAGPASAPAPSPRSEPRPAARASRSSAREPRRILHVRGNGVAVA